VIERHLPYLVLHGLALVAARAKGEPELLPVEIQTERLPGSGAADE
jgi:hypothetical protein